MFYLTWALMLWENLYYKKREACFVVVVGNCYSLYSFKNHVLTPPIFVNFMVLVKLDIEDAGTLHPRTSPHSTELSRD